ncbi:17763_t:CDS:2 [Funneliformis caledonium]|uniref:Ragulator complex protein LAMTOR1 n=1 Tax=Funneliformis caledonium TaxID=1117310 RepID=A0A9N8YRI6_9GLOM|nr:17763_t:CDS:2 [Funneliformis caledonium]
MGCCGSKDEDDNAKNERSRLLSGEGSTAYDTSHARMNYRYDDAVDHTIEQEALQKIVQQTADNFIDISNTHATERLQQQEAIDRANEYKELMGSIKLDPNTLQKIQEKSDTLPKLRHKISTSLQSQQVAAQGGATDLPPHVVLGSGGVTREDQEWLTKAIDEMHEAIEHIEVEYVGDLVVPLTWANSAPIHAIHG